MIEIVRNDHHMNGESVPVIEIWTNDAMAVAIPADPGDQIRIKDEGADLTMIEMRLCEQTKLILKPNIRYIFTVDPDCEHCVKLEAIGANHG